MGGPKRLTSDGQTLITGGYGSHLKVWNTETRELVKDMENSHVGNIQCVCLTIDDKFLFSAGADKHLRQWRVILFFGKFSKNFGNLNP